MSDTTPSNPAPVAGTPAPSGNPAPAQTQPVDNTASPVNTWISETFDQNGNFVEGWATRYDKPEALDKYKTFDDLVKGYTNAQDLIGRKPIGVPTETSTPDEIAAYRNAIGVPASADGYEQPEYYTEEEWRPLAEAAHASNIPAEGVHKLLNILRGRAETHYQDNQKLVQEHLRQKFGADHDKNAALLEQHMQNLGLDPNNQFDIAASMNPVVIDLMWADLERSRDGGLNNIGGGLVRLQSAKDELASLMKECRGNPQYLEPTKQQRYTQLLQEAAKK